MKRAFTASFALILPVFLIGCDFAPRQAGNVNATPAKANGNASPTMRAAENPGRLIHVIVALCDNEFQGIVPVPVRIGNGDDPANNLYWGAAYGVKSFFKNTKDWQLIAETQNPKPGVLERIVLKHKNKGVYIVADAYRGREIKQSTIDFLEFAAGKSSEPININVNSTRLTLQAGGGANLIAYVGHDGLMDFTLAEYPQKSDERQREAIILACASKSYFARPLRQTGAKPLLWTTGLMAPESYVLKAAVDGWILNEGDEKIRKRAAEAYNAYQRCGLRAAMNLFAYGW